MSTIIILKNLICLLYSDTKMSHLNSAPHFYSTKGLNRFTNVRASIRKKSCVIEIVWIVLNRGRETIIASYNNRLKTVTGTILSLESISLSVLSVSLYCVNSINIYQSLFFDTIFNDKYHDDMIAVHRWRSSGCHCTSIVHT